LGSYTVAPNRLTEQRLAAGIAEARDLAARAAIDPALYQHIEAGEMRLAEALGVAHPDRAQAAYHVGDPVEVVRQTRRIWESWGLSEDQALALATDTLYPLGDGPIGCSCDDHGRDVVIPIDVLAGRAPGLGLATDA
jgi:hypothetical protein